MSEGDNYMIPTREIQLAMRHVNALNRSMSLVKIIRGQQVALAVTILLALYFNWTVWVASPKTWIEWLVILLGLGVFIRLLWAFYGLRKAMKELNSRLMEEVAAASADYAESYGMHVIRVDGDPAKEMRKFIRTPKTPRNR